MALDYSKTAYIRGETGYHTVTGLSHNGISANGSNNGSIIAASREATAYFNFERHSIVFGRSVATWEIAPTDPVNNAKSEARAVAELKMTQYANRVYDIAPKLETITLTAFFARDDLPYNRDTFMELIRGPFQFGWQGKLKLKLPDFDEITVMAGAFELTADREHRNLEYCSGTFYVVPEDGAVGVTGGLNALIDTIGNLITTLPDSVINKSLLSVTEALNPFRVSTGNGYYTVTPTPVKESTQTVLQKIQSQFSSIISQIQAVEDDITTPVAELAAIVKAFTDGVDALINTPSQLFNSLYSSCSLMISSVEGIGSQIESQYAILDGILTGFETMATGTDTENAKKAYAGIIETSTDAFALTNIGSLYTTYSFPTQSDALAAITRYRTYSDDLLAKLEYDGMPDISDEIRELTGLVIKYLMEEAANLPSIKQITVPDQIPVIATCYEQYGDISDDHIDDIISRNNVQNANFPPRELNILKSL